MTAVVIDMSHDRKAAPTAGGLPSRPRRERRARPELDTRTLTLLIEQKMDTHDEKIEELKAMVTKLGDGFQAALQTQAVEHRTEIVQLGQDYRRDIAAHESDEELQHEKLRDELSEKTKPLVEMRDDWIFWKRIFVAGWSLLLLAVAKLLGGGSK